MRAVRRSWGDGGGVPKHAGVRWVGAADCVSVTARRQPRQPMAGGPHRPWLFAALTPNGHFPRRAGEGGVGCEGRVGSGEGVLGQFGDISAPWVREECCAFRGLRNKREINPPPARVPYACRMTDWKAPPQQGERDTEALWARMGVLEDAVLRVVDDERRDPLFRVLAALAAMMATLQRRILRDERWNRRVRRKAHMLDGEAMRMNMCDRLGGEGPLQRWQDKAQARFEKLRLADGGGSDDGGPASSAGTWKGGREPEEGRQAPEREAVREFALPRLPSVGGRRRRRGGVRSPVRFETPIAVWPCEVMPERFRQEWWKTTRPLQQGQRHTSNRRKPHRRKFPENSRGVYPGPLTSESLGKIADVGGPVACTTPSSAGAWKRRSGRAPPCCLSASARAGRPRLCRSLAWMC